jgi:hypothetical protein
MMSAAARQRSMRFERFSSLGNDSYPLAIGYWLLAIGYWLLAIGYWLLAIGHTAALAFDGAGQ